MKKITLKDILTKDVKPFKTLPNRRTGLASGYTTSLCSLIALLWILTCLILKISIPTMRLIISLVVVEISSSIVFFLWSSYSRKQNDIEESNKKKSI